MLASASTGVENQAMDDHVSDSPGKCSDERPLDSPETYLDSSGQHPDARVTIEQDTPPGQSVHNSEAVQQKLRKRKLLLVLLVSATLGVGLAVALAIFYLQPDPKSEPVPVDTSEDSVKPVPLTQVIKQRVVGVLPVTIFARLRARWPALVAVLVAVAVVVACSCLLYYFLETTAAVPPDLEVPVDPHAPVPGEDPIVEEDKHEGLGAIWITMISVGCGLVVALGVGGVIWKYNKCACLGRIPGKLNTRETLHITDKSSGSGDVTGNAQDNSISVPADSVQVEQPQNTPEESQLKVGEIPDYNIGVRTLPLRVEEDIVQELREWTRDDANQDSLEELKRKYITALQTAQETERSVSLMADPESNPKKLIYFHNCSCMALNISNAQEHQTILNACRLLNENGDKEKPCILLPIDNDEHDIQLDRSKNKDFGYGLYEWDLFLGQGNGIVIKWLTHVINGGKLDSAAIQDPTPIEAAVENAKATGSFLANRMFQGLNEVVNIFN